VQWRFFANYRDGQIAKQLFHRTNTFAAGILNSTTAVILPAGNQSAAIAGFWSVVAEPHC